MNFTFPSYNELKKELGKLDAMIELNEVAVREFISQAKGSGDFGDFLKAKSEVHKIRVDLLEVPQEFSARIARGYITQVSQCLEEFLTRFKKEHTSFKKKEWAVQDTGKSKLELAFKNVVADPSFKVEKFIDYRICEYYRLVRNSSVHNENDKKIEALNEEAKSLSSMTQVEIKYSKLSAPNGFNNINFDDFILYSRATKAVALELCKLGEPKVEEIVDLVKPNKYTKHSNKPGRTAAAIKTELRSSYGIPDEISEQVIKIIDNI